MTRSIRQCHRCRHNGKGHKACLKCKLPALSNHGASHISLDALGELDPEFVPDVPPGCTRPSAPDWMLLAEPFRDADPDDKYRLPSDHAAAVVKDWAKGKGLTPRQMGTLEAWLKPGSTKASVARELGIGVPRVHQILKKIAGGSPALLRAFRIRERT